MKKFVTPFRAIIFGFLTVILIGTFFLMTPLASQSGQWTPFIDSLFTATSAVCVTGLVVHDTATYWTMFGQVIILCLIQIGGLGVITIVIFFTILSKKKITLQQRIIVQEAISAPKVGGILRLTSFVMKYALLIELIGAICMLPVFYSSFGMRGIWMSLFHSISAFCNAGFDLMGNFSSLTSYVNHPWINFVIMSLIVIGGIGFFTWEDIAKHRYHIHKYRLQSKVIISVTFLLILLPTIYFYCAEYTNLSGSERVLASLFQAVTPRTAGFNTTDLSKLRSTGQMLMIILMLIGGAPGSTAGGMKVTTIGVLFANLFSVFQRKESPDLFGRRIENVAVSHAATIFIFYLLLFLTCGWIICLIEDLPLSVCLFETASAIGTVGLTLGITTKVCTASRLILILLMFIGRVGGLTLIYSAYSSYKKSVSKLPIEKITIG